MSLYWRKTSRLTAVLLSIWFVTSFVLVYFARDLNFRFFGWPLSFYMAAQGSLIVFVVMLFVFAWQQDRIDRQHGVAEDD